MVAPRTIAARLLDDGTLLARTEFDEVTLTYNSIEKTGHVYSEEFDELTLSRNTPSGGSFSLNGTSDRVYIVGNSDLMFGTAAYTIEGWFNTTSTSYQRLWDFSNGDSVDINGSTIYYWNGSATVQSGSGVIPQNRWFHVALVRNSQSDVRLYVNGVERIHDTVPSYNSTASRPLAIGGEVLTNADGNFAGNIAQFRIVKGLAVYTGTFSTAINPLSATQPATLNTRSITGTETKLLLSVAGAGTLTTDSGNGSAKTITTTGSYSGSTPSTQNHNGKMKQRSTGELLVANEFDEYNTAALQ
jgi:hypothetical protein